MKNQKKQNNGNMINPITAAMTGAVVGAGIAVGGAVALKNKKNRDKVKEVLSNVKEQTVEYMGDIQQHSQKKADQVGNKLYEKKV